MSRTANRHRSAPGGADNDTWPYQTIVEVSLDATRSPATFDGLVTPSRYVYPADVGQRIDRTVDELLRFQRAALDVFRASMTGDASPSIARAFLDHLPAFVGWDHHRSLRLERVQPPMFFRTDQTPDGKVLEVQCPGSLWGVHEVLSELYDEKAKPTRPQLSRQYVGLVQDRLGAVPKVHHLLDNSSHPAGEQFFIQRARQGGARYFGYDTPLRPQECNLVRAHDFLSLLTENFGNERLVRFAAGEQLYDLPPVAVFDQKLLMALPFWEPTRDFFSDGCRDLFPYTTVLEPSGLRIASGEQLSIERFSALSRRKRGYYLKYAGADISRNWGSRSVFHLGKLSAAACERLLKEALGSYRHGDRWIVQEEVPSYATIAFVTRDGAVESGEFHAKWSVFCGPEGAMGVLLMFERFYKVHASIDTVATVAGPMPERPS